MSSKTAFPEQNTQHQETIHTVPLDTLLILEEGYLDGAISEMAAFQLLSGIYSHLVEVPDRMKEYQEKPSKLYRHFSPVLGSMSNHTNKHIAFQAKDIIRELKLKATIPWNDMENKYWENSYTEELYDPNDKGLVVNLDQPVKVDGWRSYVMERKPYDDDELNEQFVEANLNAGVPDLELEEYEDRNHLPEHFRPEFELGSQWRKYTNEFRSRYYNGWAWLREYLAERETYINREGIIWGKLELKTWRFLLKWNYKAIVTAFREMIDEVSSLPIEEQAQFCYSMADNVNIFRDFAEINHPKKWNGGPPTYIILYHQLDEDTIAGFFPHKYALRSYMQKAEDEILEKLSSDGYLNTSRLQPENYRRIKEMGEMALEQILSVMPNQGKPQSTRSWNRGYIKHMIEDGYDGAYNTAWDYFRDFVSPTGAMAFDLHESQSEGWKAFNIVGRKSGEIKDIVIEINSNGVVVAPEYNPEYQKTIEWGLALHKLRQNEFSNNFFKMRKALGKHALGRYVALSAPSEGSL